MLPDFKMIVHKFPDNPDIEIWPIADVHLGAAEHNSGAWAAFCQDFQKRENAYLVLAGDLLNNCTRSSISNIYEEVLRPREQKKLMAEMLEPLKDRILCCVSGNHERRNKDVDDSPAYDIMCKLNCEHLFRENMAFVKLQFGEIYGAGQQNPTYMLAVTHGAGGGALTGGVVNRAERFAYTIDGCDILILGHSHKPFTTQPSKIYIDKRNEKVSFKPFKVLSVTSWMDYGGYAVQKMLSPTSIAPQVIRLSGRKKQIEVTM